MEQSLTLAPALSDTPAIAVDSEIGQLSLWRLIGRRFFRNRLAVGGGALILCLYVMVIFAEFFTPYDHLISDENFVTHPPQLPRFIDAEGNFHLRPFVYGTTTSLDTHNLDWLHEDDTEQIYPFKLFVKGVPYKLLGLIPAERHLYGVEAPGTAFLLGTDRLGRDMFSRIVFGGRISLTVGLVGVSVTIVLGSIMGQHCALGRFGGSHATRDYEHRALLSDQHHLVVVGLDKLGAPTQSQNAGISRNGVHRRRHCGRCLPLAHYSGAHAAQCP